MQPTHLTYLEDMALLTLDADVVAVLDESGRTGVVLDRTVFYAQGGGQPFDQGCIRSASAVFAVSDVRFVDGIVKHYGSFESGGLAPGDPVRCEVDGARRALHARLHSAGHIIDMAVTELGLPWRPGKGYHFPDGPYVEYAGSLEGVDRERLKADIQRIADRLTALDQPTEIRFMPQEEMAAVCRFVPDRLPEGKPARVVLYGGYGVPCGGTHVANLKDIAPMTVREAKEKKGAIRVSYQVA